MNTKWKSSFGAVLAAAAVLALSGAGNQASANDLSSTTFEINSVANTEVIGISTNSGASYESVYTGRYGAQLNGQNVYVYCVDPTHDITVDQSYTADAANLATAPTASSVNAQGFYDGGLGSEITTTNVVPGATTITSAEQTERSSEVAWLTDTFLNGDQSTFSAYSYTDGFDLSQDEAAVQLSIWDIIEDGGDGLSTGLFQTDSSDTMTYGTLVSDLEMTASNYDDYSSNTATWIQSSSPQDGSHAQNQITVLPTPEPSAASIFGIGFGALLLAAGLQRKRSMNRA